MRFISVIPSTIPGAWVHIWVWKFLIFILWRENAGHRYLIPRVSISFYPDNENPLYFRPYFAWYDLWIGAYIDTKNGVIYVGVPMVGIRIFWYGIRYWGRR